jgi:cobalamin biosynthesis Co2+ chelatase CbiK
MSEEEDPKKQLDKYKTKKKKLDIVEGLLSDAKSYEGKLEAVKIIAEREKNRTILLIKGMIAKADEDRAKIAAAQEKAKRETLEKEALERAAKIAKDKLTKKKK